MHSRRNRRNRGYSSSEEGMNSTRYIRDWDSLSTRIRRYSDNENSSRSRNSSESSSSGDESNTPSTIRYAGAKFNMTPPASMLPPPPASWISSRSDDQEMLNDMACHLREILKVSA